MPSSKAQTYRTLKAMSDKLFSDPERLSAALKEGIRKAKREKLILKQLNELCNENK